MTGDMQPSESKLEHRIAVVVLVALLAGCLLVLLPFVSAILWAIVLCVSSWPLYTKMLGWLGNRRSLVAAIMGLAMILIVLLPFVVVGL